MIKKKLYRMRWKGFRLKKRITDILCDEKGIGVVEVILILVVLIGLVIIFKSQLTSLVNTIFEKITSESSGI
ncbi:MAG: Flp1 family type IVb pilin [Clostridium sp.]